MQGQDKTCPRFKERQALLTPEVPPRWGEGSPGPSAAHPVSFLPPPPQLDADNVKPNFDEENGQDEYDEVAMPV